MATAVGKDEEDVWGKARKAADDLYEIRDTFYPQNPDDKTSKLQHEPGLALKLLDSIPAGIFSIPTLILLLFVFILVDLVKLHLKMLVISSLLFYRLLANGLGCNQIYCCIDLWSLEYLLLMFYTHK
ncbi:hypothetical protein V6N13_106834 [Hibiscus sabdariffa]|uniref:Uncharacterized protein n=1 Tax=Hibiscus sabdariffa TaxID=183260 RepID=A0ABR2F1X9_9ROSI